jgi:hypothetical protein
MQVWMHECYPVKLTFRYELIAGVERSLAKHSCDRSLERIVYGVSTPSVWKVDSMPSTPLM